MYKANQNQPIININEKFDINYLSQWYIANYSDSLLSNM